MSFRAEKEKQRQIQEKCQIILNQLLREEDNKYCVDCDAKGPRWASWNLGIFLCIRCAGIHRNLGVHISKVKSVNLDTWTPEQVAYLQNMGNSQARAIYEANLPDNFRRPQTDSALENFIRSKYETKKYIAKEWVPPPPPKPAFDIEEEWKKEKDRRRLKKATTTQQQTPGLAVPRPQASSPTPPPVSANAVTAAVPATTKLKQEPSVDLLGLDVPSSENQPSVADATCNDIFNNFLQADTTSLATPSPGKETEKPEEEQNFFKTPTTEKKVAPLSKESILSLYGSQHQQVPPPPSVYSMPGGLYPAPAPALYPQPATVGIASIPNGLIAPHPPPTLLQQPQPPLLVQGIPASMSAGTNPFLSAAPAPLAPAATAAAPFPFNTWQGGGGGAPGLAQVQGQMASMQINSTPGAWGATLPSQPASGTMTQSSDQTSWPGHTLSTNLWH